jgi:diaminohydroxyphosphoribosylaminopyrimidine deaminase/5-amino-6-(5-phosphoribosylamino)uracil reductase
VDKVVIFYSPKILGGTDGLSLLAGTGPEQLDGAQALFGVKVKKLGDEFIVQGYLKGQ